MTRFNQEESAAEVELNMLDVMKWEAVHRHVALTQHMSWLIPVSRLQPPSPYHKHDQTHKCTHTPSLVLSLPVHICLA